MPDQLELWAEWIVGDLLELRLVDRPSALRRACGNDAALNSRVEALLRSLYASGDFFTDPVTLPDDDDGVVESEPPSTRNRGTHTEQRPGRNRDPVR